MSGYPWIKEWLDKDNKSQAQLARALGLDGPKTHKSIKGSREFTPKEILACAKFFDKTAEEVITGSSPAPVFSGMQNIRIERGKKILISLEVV